MADTYRLGRVEDSHKLKSSLVPFREAYPSIPESAWPETDQFEVFAPPILFQIQNGCVGHGGSTAFTIAWVASGQEIPPEGFSPTWAYALINGGIDSGAMIGDLIPALQNVGLATADVFPEDKYMLGGASEQAARPVAANYRIEEAYRIFSWEEKGTAIAKGFSCADSVAVVDTGTFGHLDPNGFPPVHHANGDHCTCPGGIRKVGGKAAIRHQNSWGPKWGPLNGFFFTNRDHVVAQGESYSGIVIKSVKRMPATSPIPAPILD